MKTSIDIPKLYDELEALHPYGGYVSRSDIFGRAYKEGRITSEVYDEAREYYGKLWNYTGD